MNLPDKRYITPNQPNSKENCSPRLISPTFHPTFPHMSLSLGWKWIFLACRRLVNNLFSSSSDSREKRYLQVSVAQRHSKPRRASFLHCYMKVRLTVSEISAPEISAATAGETITQLHTLHPERRALKPFLLASLSFMSPLHPFVAVSSRGWWLSLTDVALNEGRE